MSVPDILDSCYSWFRLGITLLIATIGNVGMWAVIMILPAIQAEFGIDRADASIPYTLTMIGFAIGNVVIGRAVDRFGVTWSLIGAAIVTAAGFALSALSGSIIILCAIHFVLGFGASASFGPLMADISHWFLRRRGIAVAIAASGNYLSGAIWPVALSGVLADQGWRAVYFALATLTVAIMVPAALLLRRHVPFEATDAADQVSQRPGKGNCV